MFFSRALRGPTWRTISAWQTALSASDQSLMIQLRARFACPLTTGPYQSTTWLRHGYRPTEGRQFSSLLKQFRWQNFPPPYPKLAGERLASRLTSDHRCIANSTYGTNRDNVGCNDWRQGGHVHDQTNRPERCRGRLLQPLAIVLLQHEQNNHCRR